MQMAILPVLDLMRGQIVRGVGGRRDEYRPIVSNLCASAEPLAVAHAFCVEFGFREFYLADLDAIQHGAPNVAIHKNLVDADYRLWIDAGATVIDVPNVSAIVGLETLQDPDELSHIVQRVGSERVVFSLDLKDGQPKVACAAWRNLSPWEIAKRVINEGVRRLIVLDLAQVGMGEGVGTEDLCRRLKYAHSEIELTAGGGVRSMTDVRRLHSIGVDFVLVASALHDGRITPDDVKRS